MSHFADWAMDNDIIFLLLALGTFVFSLAFYKDMMLSLRAINEIGKAKKTGSHIFKQLLIEFIDVDFVMKTLCVFCLVASNFIIQLIISMFIFFYF